MDMFASFVNQCGGEVVRVVRTRKDRSTRTAVETLATPPSMPSQNSEPGQDLDANESVNSEINPFVDSKYSSNSVICFTDLYCSRSQEKLLRQRTLCNVRDHAVLGTFHNNFA